MEKIEKIMETKTIPEIVVYNESAIEHLRKATNNLEIAVDCLSVSSLQAVTAFKKIGKALLSADQVDSRLEKLEDSLPSETN